MNTLTHTLNEKDTSSQTKITDFVVVVVKFHTSTKIVL